MPPKKAPVQEKVLLGRPGNNLKSGIVCEHVPTSFFFFFPAAEIFLPGYKFFISPLKILFLLLFLFSYHIAM